MIKHRLILLTLIAFVAMAFTHAEAQGPKNVILLIGDGMGFAQVTLARMALDESDATLNMDTMRCGGAAMTHAANATVTDSAAAASALATGFKTNNGMVSMLPDGTPVETILQVASRLGKSTALVTTTTLTHATPAAFGAHVNNRGQEAAIAVQLLDNEIDVLFGGGKNVFVPEGSVDGRNLIAEAESAGYTFVETREDVLAARGGKLLGLFQMGPLTTNSPEPTLAELTEKAIEVLSANDDGFFLMVEGGQIDWACHANDTAGTIKHMFCFDAAVGKALDFMRLRRDTLVIVTADHETGGLIINEPNAENPQGAKWNSGGHTAVDVPVFAEGIGSIRFSGIMDNTDIPTRIARLWGVTDFPSTK